MQFSLPEAINVSIEGLVVLISVIIGARLAMSQARKERTASLQMRWLEQLLDLWLTHRHHASDLESLLRLNSSRLTQETTAAIQRFYETNQLLFVRMWVVQRLMPMLSRWALTSLYSLTALDMAASSIHAISTKETDQLSTYNRWRKPLIDAIEDFRKTNDAVPTELIQSLVTVAYYRPLARLDKETREELQRLAEIIESRKRPEKNDSPSELGPD